ncbi:MAG: hypothetical protein PHZ24_06770, partial [Bacteroidales bacterium]|nr:hypothetical protein [Bacteroidales bacterium]
DYLMHTDIAFVFISENGRLYDPVIARVLSPDNNVQNPNNPQSYNRYSYCYNNPLKFTDPDGEFVVPLAATILVGGYMHFTGHTSSEIFKTVVPLTASLIVPQFTTAYNFLMSPVYANQLGMSAAQGYLGGVISTGLSFLPRIGGVNMPFGVNLLLGVIQGGVYGGFYAMLWGGNVGKGFKRGAIIGASTTTATSENLINLIRGGGFYTDQKIYNKLLSNNENQEIIDYFVGQGNYRPGIGDVANVNNETYEITFSEKAFEKGWKYFKMVYHEELYHYADKMAGNYNHIGKDQWHTGNPEAMFAYHRGEYKAKVYGYRNQWRYSNIKYDWVSYIDRHGCQMNYPPFPDDYTFFQVRAWHLLYKIPRRW